MFEAAAKYALDLLNELPKEDPKALRCHMSAVLAVFWGALWRTFGKQYARGFIDAQRHSMGME